MTRRLWVMVCLCCLVGLAAVAPAVGATERCRAVGGQKVCLTDVTVTTDELVVNQTATVKVTLENRGEQVTTSRVTMNTAGPNNTTRIVPIGRPQLQPGESTTITQPVSGETPGTHGVQVLVVSSDGTHRFDISEIKYVEVLAEPPTELGGRIDRTELSLGVLLLALVGAGATGYRYFGPKTDPDETE
ncbi:CARDB domain-containing protein [Halobaculum sp. MBLA0143]|uniref:CARDB domain-containing protein n=1 Tax=Halobaculum sp. MBLA0143 TaxID=3079933 RepID=UPI0035233533